MLSTFVSESSIHGVKYLVEAKHAISKFLWLVCICASFTAAFVFIYQNIINWNNSPAVVTSVRTALVKVG